MQQKMFSPNFRSTYLRWIGSLLLTFCCVGSVFGEVVPPSSHLQIITSFSPLFYEPLIEKFREVHPEITLSVLNKKTTSAIAEILRGNKREFDIFWSSSPDAFAILRQAKLLRPFKGQSRKIATINNIPIGDPDGYITGFALSGVGWMWNEAYLQREGLPIPVRWDDISKEAYYNHIVMSTPSRSGSTHLIVESILQSMGWEKGWEYLIHLSKNLVTLSARSFSVAEGVKRSQFGIGLVIDILGRKSDANAIGFRYGEPALLCSASVGILQNGKNLHEASVFIEFLLSEEGQRLLLRPEINRLPVRKSMLSDAKKANSALYSLIQSGKSALYDTSLSQRRYNLVNRLFDECITFTLLERRQLWSRLRFLEEEGKVSGKKLQQLRSDLHTLLCEVPVTHEQSRDSAYSALFLMPQTGIPVSMEQQQQVARWRQFWEERFAKANRALNSAYIN